MPKTRTAGLKLHSTKTEEKKLTKLSFSKSRNRGVSFQDIFGRRRTWIKWQWGGFSLLGWRSNRFLAARGDQSSTQQCYKCNKNLRQMVSKPASGPKAQVHFFSIKKLFQTSVWIFFSNPKASTVPTALVQNHFASESINCPVFLHTSSMSWNRKQKTRPTP